VKYILFLANGMADEPIESLGGKTPLMVAHTPTLDALARRARFATYLSLPEGYPATSDVAQLSILGYDLAQHYPGRGPLEAAAHRIPLAPDEIAMRCNLVTASDDGRLLDHSGGHIRTDEAAPLIAALQDHFASLLQPPESLHFHAGANYRNLLVLRGERFSPDFDYEKPDDHPGDSYTLLLPTARGAHSEETVALLHRIILESLPLLSAHPVNQARVARGEAPANMAWPWAAGHTPALPPFRELHGQSGAIISAAGVIQGIGALAGMEVIEVEGATGSADTHYEGKAMAAIAALERHDFVCVHLEVPDDASHEGNLELKIQAIQDFDHRLVEVFLREFARAFGGVDQLACAVLPDHAVSVVQRKHTRTPVPVMFVHPGARPDRTLGGGTLYYDEFSAAKGSLGLLHGDAVMRTLFGTKEPTE
jgi:2,3-bisphosphoglycerate-independent phosphoglycerate mutase